MATPRGAEHRDLEQRFRNLERIVRELVSAALSRNVLQVSDGDFQVTGGGDVVVQDGGQIRQLYPNGNPAVVVGPLEHEGAEAGVELRLGWSHGIGSTFRVTCRVPGVDPAYPDGLAELVAGLDELNMSGAANLTVQGPKALIRDDGAGLRVSNNGTRIEVLDDLWLENELFLPGLVTTSNVANVRMSPSSGRLFQVSSSLRYKQDVERPTLDTDALLQLQPATWRDRAEVEADPDTETRHIGFIAEDLDELGLGELVDYDDQGRPDAVRYDRVAVPLLELAKEQQSRLDDMERRLAALEAAAGA